MITSPKQTPKIARPCCRLITPLVLDQNYVLKKTQVIKAERRVLKELGFCVHVKHPHKLIVMYLQALGFEQHQSLMQLSWNYMNDSLRTDVFLQFDPETIACACIYLSARKLQVPLPKSPSWYSLFNASEMDIQDICHKILKLYLRSKVVTEDLERRVEELKKEFDHAKEKAKIAITNPIVQTEILEPLPSNGISTVQENDSTTPTKNPIKKRSRSRTPSETKSGSRSPKHLKKSKKRNHERSRSKSTSDRRTHKHHRKSNKSHKRYSSSSSDSSSSSGYHHHKSSTNKLVPTYRDYKDYRDYRGDDNYKSKSRSYNYWKKFYSN